MSLIRFTWQVDGVLTDADSVKLSSQDAVYGVKRTDTDAIVTADATTIPRDSLGTYEYDLTDPAVDLTYELWVEVEYAGQVRYYHKVSDDGLIEVHGRLFNPLSVPQHATIFHNMETVAAHIRGWRNGAETDTEYEVTHALRRSATEQDLRALEQQGTVYATVFHLPTSELAAELRRDDWIEAADANWTVVQSRLETFGTRQRCLCIRQEGRQET